MPTLIALHLESTFYMTFFEICSDLFFNLGHGNLKIDVLCGFEAHTF